MESVKPTGERLVSSPLTGSS